MRSLGKARTLSLLAPLALFALHPTQSLAADQNGYTARYECRAGGPHCGVDVEALGSRSCNQIVAASTPWSSINWSNDTICIEAGDHTAKGALIIPPSASGSGARYKVLRYHRSNDSNDDPWKQSGANQAKIQKLIVDGADYWLIHRLSWAATTASLGSRITLQRGNSNLILSRILIEGSGLSGVAYSAIAASDCANPIDNFTLQNSVVRGFYGKAGVPAVGVSLPCEGQNVRVVSNELYDWSEHPLQVGRNENPNMPGFVVENNDIYNSPAMLTQNGTKSRAQSLLVAKADGSAVAPARIVQNRIWGARYADSSVCCDWGAPGRGIILNGVSLEYVAVMNNIVFDSQQGLAVVSGTGANAQHNSIVGNLFYKIEPFCSGTSCEWDAIEVGDMNNAEIYLNTIISARPFSITDENEPNNDMRCNVLIDSGPRRGSPTPTISYQADNNTFYGTPVISFNATGSYISKDLNLRKNSMNYNSGDVMRLGNASDCRTESDAACFLYVATVPGTSAPSLPTPCNTLGCQFSDGSVVWQAARGPYAFWRKLKTSPEKYVIPYAKPHSSALEARACSYGFASRQSIGIDDVGL